MRWIRVWPVILVLAACGHSKVRSTQEWGGVEDPRLLRTCHVGNGGTGLCLARVEGELYVLTCRHVVGDREWVPVHLPRRELGYRRRMARVVARSHPTKVDLALLRVEDPPVGAEFITPLARDLAEGERREGVDLMIVTTPERPRVWTGPVVERTVLWGGSPDETGSTTYQVPAACMHGGIRQANSGSPAFEGDRLVGLNHLSPFEATVEKGDGSAEMVTGIGLSVPRRVRAFLAAAGHSDLVSP